MIDAEETPIDKIKFPVMEIFKSVQGEGLHAGKSCIFIRLAGCNLTCPWCDTKESWNIDNGKWQSIDKIVEQCVIERGDLGKCIVVITGGEPLIHSNLTQLVRTLQKTNFAVHLETNGTLPTWGYKFDWITVSPKDANWPHPSSYNELKLVVTPEMNLDDVFRQVVITRPIILQPEWSSREKVIPHIIDAIHNYSRLGYDVRLGIQMHKYLEFK